MHSVRSAVFGFFLLVSGLVAVSMTTAPCHGQTTGNLADPFTGRIVFHQKEGGVSYDVTISNGLVSGRQFLGSEPIAKFVGGWFDYKKGRLSLLIQGTDKDLAPEWRSQCQQFSIDLKTKEMTLEHMLYSFGETLDTAQPPPTAHVLDSFDAAVHLVD